MNAVTFQAEVRRIEKLLYHIAWTHLGNDQDAEDAVQEALIKAWSKQESLRDEKQFKPWLARILCNQCKDMLRKRRKWSFYPLMEDTAQVEMPPVENSVLDAIRKMKPDYRILMTLHYLDGCSLRELSEITGTPMGTVKTRMRNARKQLGKTLSIEWEDEI